MAKGLSETLLETNQEKLREKILLTEWKVFRRLQQVSADNDHHEERRTIAEALNTLRILKREKLHDPDWES